MKMINSILTGTPIQTRKSNGEFTSAGWQQKDFCNLLLKEMGDNDFIEKEVLGFKTKITKKEVEEHLKNI